MNPEALIVGGMAVASVLCFLGLWACLVVGANKAEDE